jgi:acetyltransferase-like isoleucine patch superfamily enzyme
MVNKIILKVPKLSVDDEELTFYNAINSGEFITKGETIASFETVKSSFDVESEMSGYVTYNLTRGDICKVGDVYGEISSIIEDNIEEKAEDKVEDNKDKEIFYDLKLTNSAKEYIKNNDVDLSLLPKNCIITKKMIIEILHPIRKKSSKKRVVIIGAGKGSEVVIDILLDYFDIEIVGLVDDNVKRMENYSYPILDCTIETFPQKISCEVYDYVIISIGASKKSMEFRNKIFKKYKEEGIKFINAIAKSVEIRRNVNLGEGNIIGANVYIGTLTSIGNNNSISYGAQIGHHNNIGNGNLIAPGFNSSGSVNIGDNCIIPAGCHIINRVNIGNNCVFPLGYSIDRDIKDDKIIK